MDIAQQLIRTVVRAFYQTRHTLVIDALLMHSTLWVDDLATVLSMNSKELRKLCSILRDDKLVSVHGRPEIKEGQSRPQNKEYYYVDYHLAIDAIKLRVFRLEKRVRDLYKPTQERKEWYCSTCKAQWTEMEVLHKYDEKVGGFTCLRCEGLLDRNEVSATERAGSERSSRLMEQLDKLLGPSGLLRQIDHNEVPENDFEQALARHKPIERSDANPGVKWEPVKKEQASDTVHGVKVETPDVQVSFTTQQESEKAEAAKKRQRLEQQEKNVLPAWHTASTVTGQKTILGDQEEARMQTIKDNLGPGIIDDHVEVKPTTDDNQYISQYYRELEETKAADRARQEAEEAEDGDEDDDEEFENVPTMDTPASSASPSGGGVKRKVEESELDSGLNTAANTPAIVESPAKRVKIENGVADEDEEDDDEFEDAI